MTDTEIPMMDVDVPRDVAQEAVAMADRQNIAVEDALARLTHFDYPTDVLRQPGPSADCSGP